MWIQNINELPAKVQEAVAEERRKWGGLDTVLARQLSDTEYEVMITPIQMGKRARGTYNIHVSTA